MIFIDEERNCRPQPLERKKSINHLAEEPHTNYQDIERAHRSGDTNFHMSLASTGSNVVEVGRDRKDLILARHGRCLLVDVAENQKSKEQVK